jgi:hypothetical protein
MVLQQPAGAMSPRLPLSLAVIGVVGLGVWMRWSLVGVVSLPRPFGFLRHAHSHLGYFGLLFPLAWLAWRTTAARIPGPRVLVVYALATALATVGFISSGYGPVAIVGSTLVGAIWVFSALPLAPRMMAFDDPLAVVLPGLVFSFACVPPVALNLRTDPDLAYAFVATFLAGLLFLAIIPACLVAADVRLRAWPTLLVSGAFAAAFLGVAPDLLPRLGLLAFAAHLVAVARAPPLPTHARVAWWGLVVGLFALGLGLVPNIRSVAVGATHFTILGPVLATLSPLAIARHVPPWAWWIGHATWSAMAAALLAQAFDGRPWTWTVAAATGTLTALWWLVVVGTGLSAPRAPPTTR